MQQKISLRLTPSEAANAATINDYIARSAGATAVCVTGFHLLKRSIDARSRTPYINLTVQAFINEPFVSRPPKAITFPDVSNARKKVVVIGAGPAGLFAALKLLEEGIQPVILERGKDVRARRRDLAALNKVGVVNSDSNYCFGEGGAGTYSDGKLYTRSNKRGDINRILNLFVQFGAEEQILYEAHPHIGTNKLPHIITAMRQCIIEHGGKVLFDTRMTDLLVDRQQVTSVVTQHGDKIEADAVILATGHSARDVFQLLHRRNILIEAKPFALGVRAEHPQSIIDSIQYHSPNRSEFLPPAAYSLVEQVNQKGVFSFCMCPGGIIAPAATDPGELVVNGWSPSKRNNPFANSGIVVAVEPADLAADKGFANYLKAQRATLTSPLAMMYFQQMVERQAFAAGGGNFVAPAQRMADFCNQTTSASLPECSYVPGLSSSNLHQVLPAFVSRSLQQGFKAFGNKMKGYYTNEAVIVATESRTSSPVRIPRNPDTLSHPQVSNLYPCGEGAGYAGGIVSAAMDGEKVAAIIVQVLAGK